MSITWGHALWLELSAGLSPTLTWFWVKKHFRSWSLVLLSKPFQPKGQIGSLPVFWGPIDPSSITYTPDWLFTYYLMSDWPCRPLRAMSASSTWSRAASCLSTVFFCCWLTWATPTCSSSSTSSLSRGSERNGQGKAFKLLSVYPPSQHTRKIRTHIKLHLHT